MTDFEINDTQFTDTQLEKREREIFPDRKEFHRFLGNFFTEVWPNLARTRVLDIPALDLANYLGQVGLMADSGQIEGEPEVNGIKVTTLDGVGHDRLILQFTYEFSGYSFGHPPEPPSYGVINSWKHIKPAEKFDAVTVGVSCFFDPKTRDLSKIACYGYVAQARLLRSNPNITIHFVKNDEPLECQVFIGNGVGNAKITSQEEERIEYTYEWTEGATSDDIGGDIGRKFKQAIFPIGSYTDQHGTRYMLYIENGESVVEI